MDILRKLYQDQSSMEAFKEFQIEVLNELALEAVFDGKDVKGFQEARKLIEKSFDKLSETYGIINKTEITNSR